MNLDLNKAINISTEHTTQSIKILTYARERSFRYNTLLHNFCEQLEILHDLKKGQVNPRLLNDDVLTVVRQDVASIY